MTDTQGTVAAQFAALPLLMPGTTLIREWDEREYRVPGPVRSDSVEEGASRGRRQPR